MFLAVRNFP